MSYGHVKSGDRINLQILREELEVDTTYALVKTNNMEVIRMALPKGKTVDQHTIDSEISVLCLKGEILFSINSKGHKLAKDDWLYLEKGEHFSYSVKTDSILLVTIVFGN